MKEIEVACFFGINRDNHSNESVFEITDAKTNKKIIEVTFTPIELTQLLGRMGFVSGSAKVMIEDGKDPVWGKDVVKETLIVPIDSPYSKGWEAKAVSDAKKILDERKDGYDWEISKYFGSKTSTFNEDDKYYARVDCKRYV